MAYHDSPPILRGLVDRILRALSLVAPSVTDQLLVQSTRPFRWVWSVHEYKSDTPSAAPDWTQLGYSTHYFNPITVGGVAKLGACSGYIGIYSASSLKIGVRILDEDTNVIATGEDIAQTTGWRSIALSGDASNLQDTVKRIIPYNQVLVGTPAAVITSGWDLYWEDA